MENQQNIIPKSWNDIKFKQGIKLFTIESNSGTTEDEYFKSVCEALEINLNLIQASKVKEVKDQLFKILENKPATDFNHEFIIGGQRFILDTDLNAITWGQFTTFEVLLEQGVWQNMDKIIAMMVRPSNLIDGKFIIEPFDENSVLDRAQFLSNTLSVQDIWGIVLFFYLIVKDYLNLITTSFLKRVQDFQMSEQKSLEKYGGGYL